MDIKSIMLVDDDPDTNLYNKIIIKMLNITENIFIFKNGKEAIDYLISDIIPPDIIFLDINMPIMDGWEFLEEYKKLTDEQKVKIVVIMLTCSLNPDDKKRSEGYEVDGYINKPLDKNIIKNVIKKYF